MKEKPLLSVSGGVHKCQDVYFLKQQLGNFSHVSLQYKTDEHDR